MAIPLNVLLVDDDLNICRTLNLSLKDQACTVVEAHSVREALEKTKKDAFDVVLTDFRMEGGTGLELVKELKSQHYDTIMIVMTAFASYENAVSVVKAGAFDYLPKPFKTEQLIHLLQKVRTLVALKRENRELKRTSFRKSYFAGFTSPASQRLEEFVRRLAPTEGTVLLLGESGTGKSELAKLIHELSARTKGPFVTVQCTTLAESLLESELFGHVKGSFTGAVHDAAGKLEQADGGTLFLDEIGDISLAGQTKLLRFLQDRVFQRVGGHGDISVNTRIIAATNKKLEEAVKTGSFREDLYFRLNVLECTLVPLRHRKEDLPILMSRIFRELKSKVGGSAPNAIPAPVMARLLDYSWPGNIRELRNVIERLLMLASDREIQEKDLPDSILLGHSLLNADTGPVITIEEMERKHIERALSLESNLEKVAKSLGITTVTLWRKRKEYGLQ